MTLETWTCPTCNINIPIPDACTECGSKYSENSAIVSLRKPQIGSLDGKSITLITKEINENVAKGDEAYKNVLERLLHVQTNNLWQSLPDVDSFDDYIDKKTVISRRHYYRLKQRYELGPGFEDVPFKEVPTLTQNPEIVQRAQTLIEEGFQTDSAIRQAREEIEGVSKFETTTPSCSTCGDVGYLTENGEIQWYKPCQACKIAQTWEGGDAHVDMPVGDEGNTTVAASEEDGDKASAVTDNSHINKTTPPTGLPSTGEGKTLADVFNPDDIFAGRGTYTVHFEDTGNSEPKLIMAPSEGDAPQVIDVEPTPVSFRVCLDCHGSNIGKSFDKVPDTDWIALMAEELPRWDVKWSRQLSDWWDGLPIQDRDEVRAMSTARAIIAHNKPYKNYAMAYRNWYEPKDSQVKGTGATASHDTFAEMVKQQNGEG